MIDFEIRFYRISREAIPSIKFWPVNHIRRDESLLEPWLDAAQAFFGLHAIAEVARTQAEIRLRISQVNRNVGESFFKLAFHFFGMLERIVADFHENMDAIAAERTVDDIKSSLFGDEVVDAAVLVNVH